MASRAEPRWPPSRPAGPGGAGRPTSCPSRESSSPTWRHRSRPTSASGTSRRASSWRASRGRPRSPASRSSAAIPGWSWSPTGSRCASTGPRDPGRARAAPPAVARYLGRYRAAPDPALPPFVGGFLGLLRLRAVRLWERLPDRPSRRPRAPGVPPGPHGHRGRLRPPSPHPPRRGQRLPGRGGRRGHRGAARGGSTRAGAAPGPRLAPPPAVRWRPLAPRPNWTPEAYLAAVERAQEHIRAGDIFQVILSQRLHARRGSTRWRSIAPCGSSTPPRTCSSSTPATAPRWWARHPSAWCAWRTAGSRCGRWPAPGRAAGTPTRTRRWRPRSSPTPRSGPST